MSPSRDAAIPVFSALAAHCRCSPRPDQRTNKLCELSTEHATVRILALLITVLWTVPVCADEGEASLSAPEPGFFASATQWVIRPLRSLGAIASKPLKHITTIPEVCGEGSGADCHEAVVKVCRSIGYENGHAVNTVTFRRCDLPGPVGSGKCQIMRRLDTTACW